MPVTISWRPRNDFGYLVLSEQQSKSQNIPFTIMLRQERAILTLKKLSNIWHCSIKNDLNDYKNIENYKNIKIAD